MTYDIRMDPGVEPEGLWEEVHTRLIEMLCLHEVWEAYIEEDLPEAFLKVRILMSPECGVRLILHGVLLRHTVFPSPSLHGEV